MPCPSTAAGRSAAAGNNDWDNINQANNYRQSVLVGITPFIEQQALWEQISNPSVDGGTWQAMGPTPDRVNYKPWATELPGFRCPSDPGTGLPALGRTNYAACLGDSSFYTRDSYLNIAAVSATGATYPYSPTTTTAQIFADAYRGVFTAGRQTSFADILDGLANTIMMGEIATDLGDQDARTSLPRVDAYAAANEKNQCRLNPSYGQERVDTQRPQFWPNNPTANIEPTWGRGFRWADRMPVYTCMFTVLPPNKALCSEKDDRRDAVAPPSSRHQGGVHVLMGDGAVKFITDSIEAGNSKMQLPANVAGAPPAGHQSNYGLWGSLGTRASKEVIQTSL